MKTLYPISFFIFLLLSSCSLYAQQDTSGTAGPSPVVQKVPWWVQRFRISAGMFVPVNTTEVKIGNTAGTFGTAVNLEDDLGFTTTTTTFLGNVQWRISRRSRLDFSYYNIKRTSAKTLQKTIEFADTTFGINAQVGAYFNTAIYQLSYGYAIFSRPKFEAGLMLGVHIVNGDVGMGLATGSGSIELNREFSFNQPLPDIGAWGGLAISKRLALRAKAGLLNIRTDAVYINILAYNAELTYRAGEHIHLSAGYTGFDFTVDVNVKKLNGYLNWGYHGPSLTMSYVFGKKNW